MENVKHLTILSLKHLVSVNNNLRINDLEQELISIVCYLKLRQTHSVSWKIPFFDESMISKIIEEDEDIIQIALAVAVALFPDDFGDSSAYTVMLDVAVKINSTPIKELSEFLQQYFKSKHLIEIDYPDNQHSDSLNFVFNSSDHLRYENGVHVSGPHGGAKRAIKVEPNVEGNEGCTVTMYNLDGNHPTWQNNVQMAPKQMRVLSQEENKIVLRGYGFDSMGGSFADYGLTILFENKAIEKCILHMHDRSVDIEYLP